MKLNYLKLVIVFLLALALGAHAESSGGSSSGSGSGSSSGSGSNSGGGSGGGSYKLGSANITPGNVTPPTPAKNSDRQTQSKAAAAAARAGAGMQRVMCFKMMNDARKQSDSTDKAIMMMMANQACQQASQTEQNADKNDQAAKALSADDVPKQGTLTAGKFQLDPQSAEEPTIPVDSATAASSGEGGGGSNLDLTLPTAEPFDPSLVAIKTPTKAPIPEATTVAKTPEDPTSPLKPIPPSEVAYDENAKKEGQTFGQASNFAAAIGAGGTYAGARPVGSEEGNKIKGSIEDSGKLGSLTGKERGIASVADAGGAGGGGPSGGGDGEKSGGDSALDAMLAQMMGGGAGGDMGPMPGQDVLVLPEKDPSSGGGTKLPNIFEFANWRFQKAAFEEGRVRTRAPKVPTLTDTAKVARASKR